MKDRKVIDTFVAFLRTHEDPGLQVDRRPDEENRESCDIDAIAGRFAIEHTSLDTLPNQRRDRAWFKDVVGDLERDRNLNAGLGFRLKITWDCDAIRKGQDWTAVRQAIRKWIEVAAPSLPEGRSLVDDVLGIPFRLHVVKASDRRPGVYFACSPPNNATLAARVKDQVNRKAKKLEEYQASGKTTILLVENDDLALMNEETMLQAIQTAFPTGLPSGIDQLWYADTSIESDLEFRDFTPQLKQHAA